jgi:hypothetical protein
MVNSMGYIREDILRAAQAVNVVCRLLTDSEYEALRRQLYHGYALPEPANALWERLQLTVSISDPNGWRRIAAWQPDQPIILLTTEYGNEQFGCVFQTPSDLVQVFGETYHLSEFYATNAMTTYLLCFNHHDYLIAAGDAIEWLQPQT